MRNHLVVCLLLPWLVLAVSCGPGKDRVRFEGKLDNITNAEFYVYSEDGSFDGVDTVRIEDGKFVYERKLEEPVLLTLLYPNFTQSYVVAEPGKTIEMRGDAAKIGESKVSGSAENELLSDFRLANAAVPENNRTMAAAQFVRSHPKTLAAVAVFKRYFASQKSPDVQTALQLLDVLQKAQPKGKAVTYINQFYRPIFENGVGRQLPEFTAETLQGTTFDSKQNKGKRWVIACVGLWQGESQTFMRQLRTKIKSAQSPCECLIVSMDVDREVLRNRLKTDSVNYPIVCDRKAFESPLVQKLGLHYVPSCMLVDAEGTIVQRDVTKVDDLKL